MKIQAGIGSLIRNPHPLKGQKLQPHDQVRELAAVLGQSATLAGKLPAETQPQSDLAGLESQLGLDGDLTGNALADQAQEVTLAAGVNPSAKAHRLAGPAARVVPFMVQDKHPLDVLTLRSRLAAQDPAATESATTGAGKAKAASLASPAGPMAGLKEQASALVSEKHAVKTKGAQAVTQRQEPALSLSANLRPFSEDSKPAEAGAGSGTAGQADSELKAELSPVLRRWAHGVNQQTRQVTQTEFLDLGGDQSTTGSSVLERNMGKGLGPGALRMEQGPLEFRFQQSGNRKRRRDAAPEAARPVQVSLRAAQAMPIKVQASSELSDSAALQKDWSKALQQLQGKVELLRLAGGGETILELESPETGRLRIRMEAGDDGWKLWIGVKREDVLDELQRRSDDLDNLLRKAGMKLTELAIQPDHDKRKQAPWQESESARKLDPAESFARELSELLRNKEEDHG